MKSEMPLPEAPWNTHLPLQMRAEFWEAEKNVQRYLHICPALTSVWGQ